MASVFQLTLITLALLSTAHGWTWDSLPFQLQQNPWWRQQQQLWLQTQQQPSWQPPMALPPPPPPPPTSTANQTPPLVNPANARVVAVVEQTASNYFASPATNFLRKSLLNFEPPLSFLVTIAEVGQLNLTSWDQLPATKCTALPDFEFSCLLTNGKAKVTGNWYIPGNMGTFTFYASFTQVKIFGLVERLQEYRSCGQGKRRRRSQPCLEKSGWGPTEVLFSWNVEKDQGPKRCIDMTGFGESKLVLNSYTDSTKVPTVLQLKSMQDDVVLAFVRRPLFEVLQIAAFSANVRAAIIKEGESLKVAGGT